MEIGLFVTSIIKACAVTCPNKNKIVNPRTAELPAKFVSNF